MANDQRPSTIDRLFLAGFMGAGKTTVGRALGEKLRWPFIDLDDEIIRRERRMIPDLFRDKGEGYFRQAESAALAAVLKTAPAPFVLAAGGGAFVQPGNADLLRRAGVFTVFLDASVEELRRRCAFAGAERPLFPEENQFRQLYEARRRGYMAADLRVETGGKTPEQIVEELLTLRF